jgi:hypothetical protein
MEPISLPTLADGRWAAVEIKLSGTQLPHAIDTLADAVGQIDAAHVGEPEFRLVVTGTGPVVVAGDGTITAPLSALAP